MRIIGAICLKRSYPIAGDREDYPVLKYAALLEAGIPKDDVKIVILKNFFPNENHAAVVTRVDRQWLILDNRTLTLVHDIDVTRNPEIRARPHEGVKRFHGRIKIDELVPYAWSCARVEARRRSITAHFANRSEQTIR
jgi:hypothetical protein